MAENGASQLPAESKEQIPDAEELRERGNQAFQLANYEEAYKNYHLAAQRLKAIPDEASVQLYLVVHLNLAAAAIKLENADSAVEACNLALQCTELKQYPGLYVKALYRKAQACRMQGSLDSAENLLTLALRLSQSQLFYDLLDKVQKEKTGNMFSGIFAKQRDKERAKQRRQERKRMNTYDELIHSGYFGGRPEHSNTCHMLQKRQISGPYNPAFGVNIAIRHLPSHNCTNIDTYTKRAYNGQFSADGSVFFTSSQDWKVRLYNTDNWTCKFAVNAKARQWTITDTQMTQDNRYLVYSSITPVVYLCNIAGGGEFDGEQHRIHQEELNFAPDGGMHHSFHWNLGIWSVRFSGDDREVIAGTSDSSVYVFDIESKTVKHRLKGHTDDVNAVSFGDVQDCNLLFSGSDDSLIYVWDKRALGNAKKPVGELVGHTEGLTYISPKGDGRYLLSNCKDQTMKLWDVRKMGGYNSTPRQTRKYPWDYRNGRYPGCVENDRHPNDMSVQTFHGHKVLRTLIRCHFSPMHSTGQRYVYTGSADGAVHIYNLSGKLVRKLDVNDAESTYGGDVVRDCSWHPYGGSLTATCWSGSICQFQLE